MAIKITENSVVNYENEPNVDRELFPNISETGYLPEDYQQLIRDVNTLKSDVTTINGEITEIQGGVTTAEENIDDIEEEIGQIKNDLNQLESAYSAFVVETETGAIASFSDGADDVPVKNLIVAIEPVQSGSGDPSPTNIRPISGWTGANISVSGINLWDEEWERTNIDWSTYKFVPAESGGRLASKNFIPVLSGKAYYITRYASNALIGYADKNSNGIGISDSSGVFTVPDGIHFIKFGIDVDIYGTTYNHDISINYPATDTTYHPYNGSSVSIDWTTEAGTVYGGTLDVTTGVLTVTNGHVDLGTLNWGYASGDHPYMYANHTDKSHGNNIICSNYPTSSASTASDMADKSILGFAGNAYIAVKDSAYNDATAFKTAMSGVQLVYELATPQTYQLTPEEVKTVLGQNNIFADTGNVTVQYRADTKLYIDKVLNA